MLNNPSTRTMNWMPSANPRLPKVKRYTPLLASMPTQDRARPMNAAMAVFSGLLSAMPARQVIANTINTKYSAGPKATAHLASSGANSTTPIVAMVPPINELQADSDRAIPALPCWAKG
ncbi:hypothetical protein D3C84_507740 [compost metagenome]